MNLGQLKMRVKRQFGDESSVQITDDDILSWANQGIIDVVMSNESLLQAVGTANLVAGQKAYTPPADLLNLRGISVKTSVDQAYRPLRGYSIQDFNEHIDRWDGDYYSAGFSYVYMYYNGIITIFPEPNLSQTNGLKIYYSKYPTALVSDSDVIPLPLVYHNAIHDYCLQQAYELDENWEGSGNKAAQFTSSLNTLKLQEETQTQDSYPVINVRAEDAW